MCEFCIRDEEARRAEAIASNGTAGPSLAGQTVTNFETGFVGTDQSNMLALVYGQKWDRNDLTFSFPDQASDYGSYITGENSTFTGLNGAQKNAAKAALGMLESYALLEFTEVTGNQGSAEIRLGESGLPGTAWAYYPDASAQSGDVWLDNTLYDDPRVGTYAYHTFMHELGHSIGLKHGHDTSGYGAHGRAARRLSSNDEGAVAALARLQQMQAPPSPQLTADLLQRAGVLRLPPASMPGPSSSTQGPPSSVPGLDAMTLERLGQQAGQQASAAQMPAPRPAQHDTSHTQLLQLLETMARTGGRPLRRQSSGQPNGANST